MRQDSRLDNVEGSLTAQQAVVLWLEEIKKYRNVCEYVQFLHGQPKGSAPIPRLTRQIDHAVREAMKGRPKDLIDAMVRRSARDIVFLVKLCLQVNFKMITEQRAWGLLVSVLAEMQNRILTEEILRNVLADKRKRVNRNMPYALGRDRIAEQYGLWQNVAEGFIVDLYVFQDAVGIISKHYFDGQRLLFPDLDEYLTELVKDAEELVRMFNGMCKDKIKQSYRINLEDVRKCALNKVTDQVALLVDMAKAEALHALGEPQAARELAEKYL